MSNPATVEHISECFIKPKYEVEESKQPCYLGPWDLCKLSTNYIQKGLLFAKPNPVSEYKINQLLVRLKESLSETLEHFYPLAGQLTTRVDEVAHQSLVFIEPNKGPGVRFIHAELQMTMSDILSPADIPAVVGSLFDHDRAVNYDGHTRPLLSVQVTELFNGVFIGVSFNHAVGDGTSYWHFWKTWSDVHKNANSTTEPPLHQRWLPEGYGPEITLPYTHPDEFISRYEWPQFRERFFHFSSESIAKLKAKANDETNNTPHKISSLQALFALIWRSVIRANHPSNDQVTNFRFSANNRHRLHPLLPESYFGNSVGALTTTTTVGELLGHDLGWAASMLNQTVANYTGDTARDLVERWLRSPVVDRHGAIFSPSNVLIGSSPRFGMYGNEFGLGKAVAVRCGSANKFPGKVNVFPGPQGEGSVDVEMCLLPESMAALEADEEFMAAVS